MTMQKPGGLGRFVATSTLGNLAPVVVGLVTAPILAQSLGVTGRGELAAATAPFLLAVGAVTMGAPEAITYHIARGIGRGRTVLLRGLTILAIAGLVATVAVIATAGLLSAGNAELRDLISLAALAIVPALLVGGIRGYAAGLQEWRLIASERLLTATLRLATILTLWAMDAITPLSGTIVIAGSSVVGGLVYLKLLGMQRPGAVRTGQPHLLRFGLGLWIGSVAGVLLSRVDQLLILPLSDARTLGIYAVAVTVAEIILVFNRSVREVVFAAESVDNQPDRLTRASRISTIVTAGCALGVGAVSTVALPWLFGADFAEAVPITLLLLVAIVVGNPGSIAGAGLNARGKPILRSISMLIAAAINIALLFVLVPAWGAYGAAVATIIGNIVAGYTNIIMLHIYFDVPALEFVRFRKSDFSHARDAALRLIPARLRKR